MAATSSAMWIHESQCLPSPMGPPAKKGKWQRQPFEDVRVRAEHHALSDDASSYARSFDRFGGILPGHAYLGQEVIPGGRGFIQYLIAMRPVIAYARRLDDDRGRRLRTLNRIHNCGPGVQAALHDELFLFVGPKLIGQVRARQGSRWRCRQ